METNVMNDDECLAGRVATQQRYLLCPQGMLRDPQGVLAEGTLRGREWAMHGGNGNIISLVDIYNGQTETLVYEYDALNRLKAVSCRVRSPLNAPKIGSQIVG